ncbi:MAG: AtpZ/AtpI family protein [Flavobacteriaceae bacterium]|nr:AtpZ/AtpI family protein [Flavobacteriaceae bacterium]
MAVITGIGAYIGYKLDEHYTTAEPIYTIIGTFIGFGIAMYLLVKQVNKFSR